MSRSFLPCTGSTAKAEKCPRRDGVAQKIRENIDNKARSGGQAPPPCGVLYQARLNFSELPV
jgi:hypothetical protein